MFSVGQKLDEREGLGPGFDFLRIILSLSVMAWHSPSISRDPTTYDDLPYYWIIGYSILFSFFALSGFLIAGSALRLSLANFLTNRGLRIFPALGVEIILSAFILGPLLTTSDLGTYFSSTTTYHYLTNMIGLVNYRLPGVFENNPVQLVNLSLWTVPFEMGCYAIMSAFIVFGMLRRPGLVVCLLCLYILIGLLVSLSGLKLSDIASQIARAFAGRGSRLYVAFVLGILAFLVRYHLPYSGRVFAACVIVCGFVTLIGPGHSFPMLNALLALPLVYITVVIGCTHVPMPKFLNRNDLSYGIYLYGMPIQQVMVDQFPSVTSPSQQFALALPPTLIFAGLSWRFVERPIANLRKRFSFVAKIRIADTNT